MPRATRPLLGSLTTAAAAATTTATATAAAAATTYRNLSAKERFNELKARNPVLGRLTESNPSSMHLAQMLDRDVRFRRPYGLHFIRRNELLRIKAVTVPAPQMWLVFKLRMAPR